MSEYSPAKTGEYTRIFLNFHNCVPCEKELKDNKYKSPFGVKICSDICPWTLSVPRSSVFLELRSQQTVHFSEQIMSVDKYPSIFSRQIATIVYISVE